MRIDPIPTPREVRAAIPLDARKCTWTGALRVLIPSLAYYFVAWFACILAPWWTWPVLVPILGVAAGVLFVLGHDAAHNALTSNRTVNQWLARLFFVPNYHSLPGWIHAHNHLHHSWTNYQPKDYVWVPLSLEEYNSLPAWRRALERFYRWWPGHGLYYGIEIVLRKIWFVQPEVKRAKVRWQWRLENLLIIALAVVHGWITILVARYFGVTIHAAWLILATQVVPAMIAIHLNGFIIYLHHTHPNIAWFKDHDEWNFFYGQVLGTTHTHFPPSVDQLTHHIMEHAAHHVDPGIPSYHLPEAQRKLISAFPSIGHNFSLRSFVYVMQACQLYDYHEHRWLKYNGEPSSARTIDEESLAIARRERASAQQASAHKKPAPSPHPRAKSSREAGHVEIDAAAGNVGETQEAASTHAAT